MTPAVPPERIRILGTEWTVSQDRDALDDDDAWGLTNHRTRTIALHPSADQPTILVHELIHALAGAQVLGLDALPEVTVQGLARGLVAVLSDNPDLLGYVVVTLVGPPKA